MALFKPVKTTGSNLSNASVVDGQFVVTTDRGEACVDTPSGRVRIADVITGTYSSITSNLAPLLDKLYFATDTHQLLQAVSNNNTLSWVQVGEPTYLTSLMTNSNSGKYLTFASDGSLVATTFPVASTSAVGGVKVDGTVVSVDVSNCLTIDKNQLLKGTGDFSIAIGTDSAASVANTIAIGTSSDASASNAIAVGRSSGASAGASNAIAVGYSAQATQHESIAIGSNAGVTKAYSTAIGYNAFVTGAQYSIQLGKGNNSSSTASFCVGGPSTNYTLMDLTTGKIPSARIPGASAANARKYLTISLSGEIVATSLPVYSGSVTDSFPQYNGEVE